jgi:hypothetical protein
MLEDRCLERLLARGGDPRTIADSIVGAALAQGSGDNCTAIVARYTAD